MKKFLFCLIASFALYSNAIADGDGDDLPGNPPPTEIRPFSNANNKTFVEIPLNNDNHLVKVQITNNEGIMVYQLITSSSSISIDVKYLQTDVYTINIIPVTI